MSAWPCLQILVLWSGRAPKVTQKWLPGSHPRVKPSDSKVTQKWLKNGVQSHFWVTFGSLWGPSAGVTFESLLGHFNSFCVSVELEARPLHNSRCEKTVWNCVWNCGRKTVKKCRRKLLGGWTGRKMFRDRFGASFELLVSLFIPQNFGGWKWKIHGLHFAV